MPDETIRHLFLDQILPRVLSQRDGVVLHGSALVIGGGGVVFMGDSGQGKSTLAVSLSRKGFPMLTDDGLYVTQKDQLLCYPSYPGVRLWAESVSELYQGNSALPFVAHYSDKQRLDATQGALPFATSPVPLRAIYLLVPEPTQNGKDVKIWPAKGQEAFREVAKGLHRFDVTNRSELLHQFELVSKVVATVPAYKLYFVTIFLCCRQQSKPSSITSIRSRRRAHKVTEMKLPNNYLGGDLFWWRESKELHTLITIPGDIAATNHIAPSEMCHVTLLFALHDTSGQLISTWERPVTEDQTIFSTRARKRNSHTSVKESWQYSP